VAHSIGQCSRRSTTRFQDEARTNAGQLPGNGRETPENGAEGGGARVGSASERSLVKLESMVGCEKRRFG